MGADFHLTDDVLLYHHDQICVQWEEELRKKIMNEAHRSLYIGHPKSIKTYKDLKTSYWWSNIKRDVAQFVEQCSTC